MTKFAEQLDTFFNVMIEHQDVFKVSELKNKLKEKGFTYSTIGDQNSKTDLPGTYRSVGKTCPKSCKFHPEVNKKSTCYAFSGFVGSNWRRIDLTRDRDTVVLEDLHAAGIAMFYRQAQRKYLKEGNVSGARLHISGDFVYNDEIEINYIEGIIYLADKIKKFFNAKEVAYTYTAITKDKFDHWREKLKEVGIFVNYSRMELDNLGGQETIVWKHDKIDEIKNYVKEDIKIIPCLSQTHNISCRQCGLCGSKNNEKILIVFDPHGVNKNNIAKTMESK